MKQGNLVKWKDISACKNLLFFAQLVDELLFDYSIPSNRISTLNSHYLCLDALSAINGIDEHGVPEGTLKPIAEELYISLTKDPAFDLINNSPLRYFVKYQNERYRISTSVSELNYDEIKKAILAIDSRFFEDNKYYETLKTRVMEKILSNEESDQLDLFRLVKSLLTELINLGYSQNYIKKVMSDVFWNSNSDIVSPNVINDFFSAFTFEKNNYTVVFIVNRGRISQFTDHIENLSCIESFEQRYESHAEKVFLQKNRNQAYLIIDRKALDPYQAAYSARLTLSINASLYRLNNHDYRYDINTAKCGVYSDSEFFRAEQEKSAVSHVKMPSREQIVKNMEALEKAINNQRSVRERVALINAARFHSHSLDSISIENQLLDLWAIFESILDISNKHTSDRIVQVCMYLVPILKRRYIYSLFSQFSIDFKNYNDEKYREIVGDSTDEAEIIQKLCEFVVLNEHKTDRDSFLTQCGDFPLFRERIEYYESVFSTPYDVYQFVEKHAERVKWQIMRIYRNRNLIIHNGDSMPYLALLVENLHSYVDDFLSYVIQGLSTGHDINSLCQELFAKECDWVADFSNRKAVMTVDVVTKMLSI